LGQERNGVEQEAIKGLPAIRIWFIGAFWIQGRETHKGAGASGPGPVQRKYKIFRKNFRKEIYSEGPACEMPPDPVFKDVEAGVGLRLSD
jgi:hypothetical protein